MAELVYLTGPEAASEGAPAQPEMSSREFAINIARAIGQGLTFGFADEAEAFARSVLGEEYDTALESSRGGLEQLREEAPVTAYGAEIAASIPSALVGGAGLMRGAQMLSKAAPMAARGMAAPVGQAGIMGGAYGAGAAEEDRLIGGGLGAVTGAGLQRFTPAVTERAKELMRMGVPLTVGQAFGGGVKRMEEAATSLPFAGDVIQAAQRRAIERFGAAAYNEALKPIGKKIDPSLTGDEAFLAANKIIDDSYRDLIKAIDFPAGKTFVKELDQTVADYAKRLDENSAKSLKRIVDNEIKGRIVDDRLSKDAFKNAVSEIRRKAYGLTTLPSRSQFDEELGEALTEVVSDMHNQLAKQNPDVASGLKKIDSAYSKFVPIRLAAARSKEGVFTPAQLRAATKREATRRPTAAAAGRLPMQAFAETGEQVLGPRLPESGTATRGMLGLTAMGGLGGLVGGLDPLLFGALGGLAGGLYTRPGQAALRTGLPLVSRAVRTPAAAGLLSQELPYR